MIRRFCHALSILGLSFLLMGGCTVDDDESVDPAPNPTSPTDSDFRPFFAPLGGLVPFPNDIFISPTTGKVSLPATALVDDDGNPDFGNPVVAMNQLNGFSTIAPMNARFSAPIDATTLTAESVIIIDITDQAAPSPLIFGADFTAGVSDGSDSNNQVLEIVLLERLDPESQYVVILTKVIQDTGGRNATTDITFQQILDSIAANTTLENAQLELIKDNAIAPLLAVSTGAGVDTANIAVIWSFTTQTIGDSLEAIEGSAAAQTAVLVDTTLNTKDILDPGGTNPALFGIADVYSGTIAVPYYLDRQNPLTEFWRDSAGDPLGSGAAPTATETLTIPLLVTVPNALGPTPGTGWPTVIFQHGITQDRSNVLAIAEALANAGFAAVAIDLPLHGITDSANPLFQTGIERTFDLDLVENVTLASGPDGAVDPSGTHFINLRSLLTSRDNLRQATSDLIHLAKTVPTLDIDANPATTDFDGSQMNFVGHSLGAITGTPFLAVNGDTLAATLAMPGGGIAELLNESPRFSPSIQAGLQASGITPGTQLFKDFLRNAQTVIDSGDALNYGEDASDDHPIHLIEVVGDADSLPDQVIPNSATDRLIAEMDLTVFNTTQVVAGLRAAVRFVEGDHSSFLDPTTSAAATVEMQTQMANFMGAFGGALVITDTTVIEP